MASILPMRGTAEMESFAVKQLKRRVPELNETFRTAQQEIQTKLRPEYTAVMQALTKYEKNPEDCPLKAGDLLRVVMTLKNKVEKSRAALSSLQTVSVKKASLETASSTKREMPVGSRGPHPLVTTALLKQKRKREDAGDEDSEETEEGKEMTTAEARKPKTAAESEPSKKGPLEPPSSPEESPAAVIESEIPPIKIPKIEIPEEQQPQPESEQQPQQQDTPKESPMQTPKESPSSVPQHVQDAHSPISVLSVCNIRIRGAQVTAPCVDGYPGRYDIENEKGWKQFLQVHGWVIVGSIATETEVDKMLSNFWDYREAMGTHIDRNNPETWTNDAWGGNYTTGLWHGHGAGQEQWMWDIREKCYPAFKRLYRTDELFTSFEGFAACRKSTPIKSGVWRIDQDTRELKFQCFQGTMSLLDSGPHDAGMCVGDGSRRTFPQFADLKERSSKFIPTQHQYDLLQNPLKLCYKKGDLILWDSRVATCLQTSSNLSQSNLAALQGFVCMVPLASATRANPDPTRLTAQQRAYRRQCIEEGRTTTHQVWLSQTEKAPNVRRTGLPIMSLAAYTPPKLSELQLRIAGIYCRSEGKPKCQLYRTDTRDVRPQESKKVRPKQAGRGRQIRVDSISDVVGCEMQLPSGLSGSTNRERFVIYMFFVEL